LVGREDITDTQSYREAMKPSNELIKEFQTGLQHTFGFKVPLKNTICRDIQERIYGESFDLSDPISYEAFIDSGGHGDKGCPLVCSVAAEITAEKIIELSAHT
jgi:hypothetical protein